MIVADKIRDWLGGREIKVDADVRPPLYWAEIAGWVEEENRLWLSVVTAKGLMCYALELPEEDEDFPVDGAELPRYDLDSYPGQLFDKAFNQAAADKRHIDNEAQYLGRACGKVKGVGEHGTRVCAGTLEYEYTDTRYEDYRMTGIYELRTYPNKLVLCFSPNLEHTQYTGLQVFNNLADKSYTLSKPAAKLLGGGACTLKWEDWVHTGTFAMEVFFDPVVLLPYFFEHAARYLYGRRLEAVLPIDRASGQYSTYGEWLVFTRLGSGALRFNKLAPTNTKTLKSCTTSCDPRTALLAIEDFKGAALDFNKLPSKVDIKYLTDEVSFANIAVFYGGATMDDVRRMTESAVFYNEV